CRIQDGWVSCNSADLLFWLPSTLRTGFWTPHTSLVVGQQQILLSYDNFVDGTEWARCYTPSSNVVL
ncbi:hypothetical protein C8R44DRAFT_638947, partial [Mycena epipterygia]